MEKIAAFLARRCTTEMAEQRIRKQVSNVLCSTFVFLFVHS